MDTVSAAAGDDSEIGGLCEHIIRGVSVTFPFDPYSCQLVYMEKVIHALQEKKNAILESPTGTGKTLCLLCATLAWRQDQLKRLRECQNVSLPSCPDGTKSVWDSSSGHGLQSAVPKIIYCSRTHSQLSQVIQELNRTIYRPRTSIIGSREQLCINPEVAKLENHADKIHACRSKVQAHSCGYYNKLDARGIQSFPDEVMDIEELVLVGHRQSVCPYYMSRELMKGDVELIFMPYNYALDAKTRKMHGINIDNSVVILDEAHNIEQVCENSVSFDLTSADIAHCVTDVTSILTKKVEDAKMTADKDNTLEDEITDLAKLKECFLALEKFLDSTTLDEETKIAVKPGKFIFEFFEAAGISVSTHIQFVDQCSKAISFLSSGLQSAHRSGGYLQKFMDAVKVVFGLSEPHKLNASIQHFKVYIKLEPPRSKKAHADVWVVPKPTLKKEIRCLSFWCFNPGHAMQNLQQLGVRQVILTSGTLSPISSFSSELKLEFPITLQGSHVISKEQIWVGVLSKGCDNYRLNSSYQYRSTQEYQASLGNTLVNFARTVPHGLLVFLPSYSVMNACLEAWRMKGVITRIEQYKHVFKEPRGKTDLKATLDAFYEKLRDPTHSGAVFFAVCRGKVSEGLDFADINGRAVIITGIPFPPRMEPKVHLKMQYLKDSQKDPKLKTKVSEEWYHQQASRAVNQAIGRVIRHKMDYGAILLCDERFSLKSNQEQLPVWVKPHVANYDKFGVVQRELVRFFKNAESKFGTGTSRDSVDKVGTSSSSTSKESGSTSKEIVTAKVKLHNEEKRGEKDQASLEGLCVPVVSLAKVQAASESKRTMTLLESLKHSETLMSANTVSMATVSHTSTAGLVDTVSQLTQHHHCMPENLDAGQKRRKVMVKPREHQSKDMKAHDFISKVKETLSNSSFQLFKQAVTQYKEDHNFTKLLESLKQLFTTPSTLSLLQGMSNFIRQEHLPMFSRYCQFSLGKPLSIDSHSKHASTKRKASGDGGGSEAKLSKKQEC